MSLVLPPPSSPPLLLLFHPSSTSAFTFLALFLAAFVPLLRRTLRRTLRRRRRRLPASPDLPHRPRRLLPCKSIPSSLDKLQCCLPDPILVPGLDLLTCVLELPALRRIASASQVLDAASAAPRERKRSIALPPPGGKAPESVGAVVDDERRFRGRGFLDHDSSDSEEAEEFVAARAAVGSADFTASDTLDAAKGGPRGIGRCAPSFEKQLGWDKMMEAKAGACWRWQGRDEYNCGGGAEQGVVRRWSAQQAALLQGSLGVDAGNVAAVGVSADHATFSLADASGEISVWDMATASCVVAGYGPAPPAPLQVSALCIDSERGLVAAALGAGGISVSDIKSRATIKHANSRSSARDLPRGTPAAVKWRGDSVYVFHSESELAPAVLDMRKMQEVWVGETGKGRRLETEEWEEEEEVLWERLRCWRSCGEEEEEVVEEVERWRRRSWEGGAGMVSTWCAGLLLAIGVGVAA